ncbi:hypothetical protein [Vagococcus silagei]|uniref:DUF1433 domain-containing protein n=1 Tax=Vagococcus silagei TaxID=2508885 RepID=A0A4S3B5A3_9ENTE|nr:hypothetical protein [Vagococcus silagei]THB62042.1 hypothetical protein ESZ54_02210 [Vagococcus silagei]
MRRKWLGLIVLIVLLMGFIGVKKMIESTQQEKQIAFLKEHETELTKYVKNETKDVLKVQYDWDNVKIIKMGNSLPNGAGQAIQIFGHVTTDTEKSFRLDLNLDENKMPDLISVHYGHAPEN